MHLPHQPRVCGHGRSVQPRQVRPAALRRTPHRTRNHHCQPGLFHRSGGHWGQLLDQPRLHHPRRRKRPNRQQLRHRPGGQLPDRRPQNWRQQPPGPGDRRSLSHSGAGWVLDRQPRHHSGQHRHRSVQRCGGLCLRGAGCSGKHSGRRRSGKNNQEADR